MSTILARPRLTAADLEALPDAKNFELVDGELVERAMGSEADQIVGEIFGRLREICRANRLGLLFGSEAGYRCFADDPNRVRRPEVSFVRAGRLPGDRPPKGYDTHPPNLAVEVLLPNDLASEVERIIDDYLRAGVRLIWIVDPETRKVRIHRGDGTITGLSDRDEVTGEDVVPGFRCLVAELFPTPLPPASA
jgi:Uma2 family endonuclease